jgi:hypothetical protein
MHDDRAGTGRDHSPASAASPIWLHRDLYQRFAAEALF